MTLVMLLMPFALCAQTKADIFRKETPITWLGIDFTEARYLGDPGTVSPSEMKNYFYRINQLILAEPDKYNLRKAFNKSYVTPNLSIIDDLNNRIDENQIMSSNYNDYVRLNENKIREMVKLYKFNNINGIAVVIIMEAMNKTSSQAAMWVAFINTADNSLLHTSRVTGKSGGFGFRNHWAGSIYNVLELVRGRKMKEWQKGKS